MQSISIIATGPTSLTGASLIQFETLDRLRLQFNCNIEVLPFARSESMEIKYPHFIFHNLRSEAENSITVNQTLPIIEIQERIIELAIDKYKSGHLIILLGTYLFPYAYAVANAKVILEENNVPCRLIIQPAGSDIWKFGKSFKKTFQYILKRSDLLVSYSSQFAQEINNCLDTQFAFLRLPPVIDIHTFNCVSEKDKSSLRSFFEISNDSKVLVCISNNRYVKAISNCIQICVELSERLIEDEFVFLIIGPITPELERTFDEIKQTKSFTNYQEFKKGRLAIRRYGAQVEVSKFLQVSDIFLNASYHDSFNTSICEALSCGLPIISSSVVGVMEFLRSTRVGHFFNYPPIKHEQLIAKRNFRIPNDQIENISQFASQILKDKCAYDRISSTSRQFIVENLSWEVLKPFYKRIIE